MKIKNFYDSVLLLMEVDLKKLSLLIFNFFIFSLTFVQARGVGYVPSLNCRLAQQGVAGEPFYVISRDGLYHCERASFFSERCMTGNVIITRQVPNLPVFFQVTNNANRDCATIMLSNGSTTPSWQVLDVCLPPILSTNSSQQVLRREMSGFGAPYLETTISQNGTSLVVGVSCWVSYDIGYFGDSYY